MSQLTKQQLQVENNTNFPNNTTGYITPALLREFNSDMINSTVNQTDYSEDSASFSNRINFATLDTASLATTGSNHFTGNQYFEAGDTLDFNNETLVISEIGRAHV